MGKYYVVWEGVETGIYDNWEDAKQMVMGYHGAKYKSYNTREEAVEAYRNGDDPTALLRSIAAHEPRAVNYDAFPEIRQDALAVDAACSKNPGPVEYRGVWVRTGQEIFRVGPLAGGTNNIGEYLAIIHALALTEKMGRPDIPIYSDSKTAQAWVRDRKAKTGVQPNAHNSRLMEVLARADAWIATHSPRNLILKWDTEKWGEIPADFGRK